MNTRQADRLKLHELLVSVLGNRNVYYQPPASVLLKYPCVLYTLDHVQTLHANNNLYRTKNRYKVTVIEQSPDSELPTKFMGLSFCSFDRAYAADNLWHFVYTLYY